VTQPDSTSTPKPADSTSTSADSPKPTDSSKPADSSTPAAAPADSGRLDQMLGLLERLVSQGAAASTSMPAPPVQQEQQGSIVVTPPTVTPEVSIPAPPVRAPEPQTVTVTQPVAASVIAPPRQLKTGDRVVHAYHDDYGSGPGGTDVVDHGIVVEQSAKQVDDGNGQSHLEYFSRVAWLRDVSDPLAEDSLELQA